MSWQTGALGFVAGLLISIVTSPVGVSGAVFLLPVQLSVLHVPSPAVTPTNLLFNVVSGPGALLRYRRHGQLAGGEIAPHWTLGLLCGAGGLVGGYVGARLQPRLPEPALRLLLGALATGLAVLYLLEATT